MAAFGVFALKRAVFRDLWRGQNAADVRDSIESTNAQLVLINALFFSAAFGVLNESMLQVEDAVVAGQASMIGFGLAVLFAAACLLSAIVLIFCKSMGDEQVAMFARYEFGSLALCMWLTIFGVASCIGSLLICAHPRARGWRIESEMDTFYTWASMCGGVWLLLFWLPALRFMRIFHAMQEVENKAAGRGDSAALASMTKRHYLGGK